MTFSTLELIPSPFSPTFDDFISSLETSCLICSPYITMEPVERLVKSVQQRNLHTSLAVQVLTDVSTANLVKGSSDINALIHLAESLPNVGIAYAPHVHAKVYISNDDYAVIGSANFTSGGARRNLEYGVKIRERETVKQISADVMGYARLGGVVSLPNLLEIRDRTLKLRDAVKEEQSAVNKTLRDLTKKLEREAQEELIKIRVEGRTLHAIFSDTLLYLLERRAMTTEELHAATQEIHPDLCDDSLDAVFKGTHFGKEWKYKLRTAQQTLRRRGIIEQREGQKRWSLVKPKGVRE